MYISNAVVATALALAIASLGHDIYQRVSIAIAPQITVDNARETVEVHLGNPLRDPKAQYINRGERSFDFDVDIVVFTPLWLPDFDAHLNLCPYCSLRTRPEVLVSIASHRNQSLTRSRWVS